MRDYFNTARFSTSYSTSSRDKDADVEKWVGSTQTFVLDRYEARSAAKIILKNDTDIHGRVIKRFSTKVTKAEGVRTSGSLRNQTLFDPRVMKNLDVMELDFSGATLSRKLIEDLEKAIKSNVMLEKVVLNVGYPDSWQHAIDEDFQINPDIALLFDALKGANHLRDLQIEMRSTQIRLNEHRKVFSALASMIKYLPNLEKLTLDIGQNKVESKVLIDIVHNMRSIKLKNLSINIGYSVGLDKNGADSFLRELEKLESLQYLNLEFSGNKGKFNKEELMSFLKKFPELRKLSLYAGNTFEHDDNSDILRTVNEFYAGPIQKSPLLAGTNQVVWSTVSGSVSISTSTQGSGEGGA